MELLFRRGVLEIPATRMIGPKNIFNVLLQNASILKILSRNFSAYARFFPSLIGDRIVTPEIAPPRGPANNVALILGLKAQNIAHTLAFSRVNN